MKNIELKKYQYIDILRGYAIIMVLFVHYALDYSMLCNSYLYNFLVLGQYGVVLFFMVSAYTLARSLEYRKDKCENYIYQKYFIRRFFRIAPLYYLLLLFSYIFLQGIGVNELTKVDISLVNLLIHFFFLDQISVLYINNIIGVEWTVAVEYSFYILLPFIVFQSNKFLFRLFVFSIFLSMIVLFFRKYYYIDGWWLHYTLLEWFYVFVGGVILYKNEIPKIILNNMNMLIFIILINMIIMSFIKFPFQHYYMFVNLVLFFIYLKHSFRVNFINNVMAYIGKISFSLYLIHYIILRYAKEYFDMSFETLLLSLIVTFIISVLTFYLIEQPFIKVGKIITSRIK